MHGHTSMLTYNMGQNADLVDLISSLAVMDKGIRTFLISSALRCKLTSFSVLTTGMVFSVEVPAMS